MHNKKDIKESLKGETRTVNVGDRFMLEPGEFLRVRGIGDFYNRSGHAVVLEFMQEEIRHGQ